ncbi:survival motor neuron protein [Contarinia nasturtii]|uniref:survival motor neuron protein n=1 Tax=Contarinia nasturtii TaxID=265458 RepID=UPI0012D48E93|nr:survival motor neuron protein [Contarinia nasturtii]
MSSKKKSMKSDRKAFVKSESNEDIWDDRLLMKAYEQAIQLNNADVAKSIAADTNKKSTTIIPSQASNMSTSDDGDDTFKVGDYVRATYNVDNIDYEAQIVSIDDENDVCVVKFIGYDNEQTVRIVDLVSSWGEEEQQKQELDAATEEPVDDGDDDVYPKELYRNCDLQKNSLPIPPIPPMPPALKDSLGEQETEHFSAMLMSWYMSGYYTGLYQGHKEAKQQQKNKKSLKRK